MQIRNYSKSVKHLLMTIRSERDQPKKVTKSYVLNIIGSKHLPHVVLRGKSRGNSVKNNNLLQQIKPPLSAQL